MKLGDKIKLYYEKEATFSDKPEITDGVFTVIGVKRGLSHCFNDDLWSQGFNCFEYGEEQAGRPDIVLKGSVYVPTPECLDFDTMDKLHHDKKIVSWEIITENSKTSPSKESENND